MNDQVTALIAQQVPIALVLTFLQDWLKRQKWFPLLDYQRQRANHLFAIAASGLATLGITFTWSAETHTLVIAGLTWSAIVTHGWHWLQQYIVTKTAYTTLKPQLNPPAPKP